MTTFRTYFSDSQGVDRIGLLTGSADYTRFPNIPGSAFRLQGRSTNIGSFLVGTASGSCVYEIDAGFDTDWFPLSGNNLNALFYSNVSGSSEQMVYWAKN